MTRTERSIESTRVPVSASGRTPAEWSASLFLLLFTLAAAPASAQGPAPRASYTPDEGLCMIAPSLEVNVGTPADGTLQFVAVDRGDLVQPGDVLARLESGVQAAAVDTQAAKVAFGARKFDRNEDLQRQQLISSQELDEIATEHKLAQLELKERQENLRLRSIVSPIRGVVVDRFRNRGDLVKQEKIFRLAQIDPLYVEVVVSAGYFGRIKAGQAYSVALQLVGGRRTAKVAAIDRVIDAASGTFRVRLQLPNPGYAIPSGQRCSVNFNGKQKRE